MRNCHLLLECQKGSKALFTLNALSWILKNTWVNGLLTPNRHYLIISYVNAKEDRLIFFKCITKAPIQSMHVITLCVIFRKRILKLCTLLLSFNFDAAIKNKKKIKKIGGSLTRRVWKRLDFVFSKFSQQMISGLQFPRLIFLITPPGHGARWRSWNTTLRDDNHRDVEFWWHR